MNGKTLCSRRDAAVLLLRWLRPLKGRYSPGCARLLVGEHSAPYGKADVALEGYARVLWGLGPLLAQSNESLSPWARQEIHGWAELTRQGLIHGTDPNHPEYWGQPKDNDHKFVEMAAIAHGMLLAPHIYWLPLTETQKDNVVRWFLAINGRKIYGNNWISFRILVNTMLYKLGAAPLSDQIRVDMETFENNYEGGGWYHDGHPGQKDYYIAFAMHFYGLLTAVHLREEFPEYTAVLKSRAEAFFRDFIYWFDGKGRSVPFGRSLTYRFAHTAAFGAMAYARVSVPMGQLRELVLDNLEYWSGQPIFDRDGVLSVGYGYPNLCMSEMYNAGGSPYWGLKSFLILALPEDHPFWTEPAERLSRAQRKLLPDANMIAAREGDDHALLYPAGHFGAEAGNADAKYQKFVYSSVFAFSISRGNTLTSGAFDSTLAASEAGEDFWRMRRRSLQFEVTEHCTRALYDLMPGVTVESIVIPLDFGHVRVHYLRTDRAIDLADGGFAIPKEAGFDSMDDHMVFRSEKLLQCDFPWAAAGCACLDEYGKTELIAPFPNTNLLHGLTVIPTLRCRVQPGEHWLAAFFYGAEAQIDRLQIPSIQVTNDKICLSWGEKTITLEGKIWL